MRHPALNRGPPPMPACPARRVHHRTAESAVGTLALNLVAEANSPAAAAQQQQPRQQLSQLGAALAAALAALAPRCLALPLSVPALNARPWWPRRDLNTQRLVGGPLQLAANTQARRGGGAAGDGDGGGV